MEFQKIRYISLPFIQINLEKGLKTGVVYIDIMGKDGQFLERIPARPKEQYILIPADGSLCVRKKLNSDNNWKTEKGQDFNPHMCLKKGNFSLAFIFIVMNLDKTSNHRVRQQKKPRKIIFPPILTLK